MKKSFTQRVGNFMEGRGFYIVLAICVAVICASGYYLLHSFGVFAQEDASSVSGEAEVVVAQVEEDVETIAETTTPAPETELPEETHQVSTAPAVADEPAEEIVAEQPVPAVTAAAITTWPVEGSVVTVFSADALLRDTTMGDWRTHEGLDLAAAIGAKVQAVGDGTVLSVYEDPILGTVMEVDHGAGLVSIYGNLSPEVLVSAGDGVTAGCVLGEVGTTAAGESAVESHLHFAMHQDGAPVNPADYLP